MKSDWQLYKRLLRYLLPLLGFLMLSILGNILYSFGTVLTADIVQLVVDSFNGSSAALDQSKAHGLISKFIYNYLQPALGSHYSVTFWVPAMMVFIAAFRGVASFLGSYYIDVVGLNIIHTLRVELFERYLQLPLAYFDTSNNAYLINRIIYNVSQLRNAVTRAATIIVREGLTVVGLFAYMVYLNWRLAVIFLALVPVLGLIISFVSKRFRRLSSNIQDSMGEVTHVSSEVIGGMRTIKGFSGEDYERDRFFEASLYNNHQSLKMEKTDAIAQPFMQFLIAIALAVVIAFGFMQSADVMTPGNFVAFLVAAGSIAKPIKQLSNVMNIIQQGLAAADDIFTVLDYESEKNTGSYTADRVKGNISIESLSFAYPQIDYDSKDVIQQVDAKENSDKLVLKSIDLQVPAGKTIALVGNSGSGKSTLVNLLPRFYDIEQGTISLDGKNIDAYELSNLRQQFSIVSQNITLFNDTIFNNIAYGMLRDASEADVKRAMDIAHVTEFVEKMPLKEQTMIGDQGVLLSGGQRQRLAIARAILKDAPVLILDEATSALDNESELLIQQALQTIMQNRTNIVIAHRLSTVEDADEIVVMKEGQIVERGTHEMLLAKGQEYSDLYYSQFKSGKSDDENSESIESA